MIGTPILVDPAGSGLYRLGSGGFAFVDVESAEDRWIRHQVEEEEARWAEAERQQELDWLSKSERDRWAEECESMPWRKRE